MKKMPQFHLLNTIQQALIEVFGKSKHADRVISRYLSANRNWSADERSLFADSLYEILRHRRLLEYCANSEELFKIIGTYFIWQGYKLPPRKEFEGLTADTIQNKIKESKPEVIEYSFPDWLNELAEKQLGKRWPNLMKALNQRPQIYLRTNTIKTNIDKLILDLKKENIIAEKIKAKDLGIANGLLVKDRKNIFNSSPYKNGDYEMQDAGSQYIASLLQIQPSMTVVDACAGSGGKSLHIAALLKNQGKLLSMDVQGYKLKDLTERAFKAGVKIIETKVIDSPKVITKLEKQFDRVLLDVPCSGLGVLKRNPDSKWKVTPEEIKELNQTQKEILEKYSEMCKVSGVMVYATCSILPQENEDQIKWFLQTQNGKKWQLVSQHHIWPDETGFDGFYAAVLKRTN